MTHGISCLPAKPLRCHAVFQGFVRQKHAVAISETPALPAGQRAGFPSSRPGARTYSSHSLTDHAGSTTTPSLLGRSGNSAPGAEGRKPGLISADQLLNAKRGRVRLSAPRFTVETAGASVPAFFDQ